MVIAQVMEHIAASEDCCDRRPKARSNRRSGSRARRAKTDDKVLEVIPDRSKKFQAPEQLRPRNQSGTPQAALTHFLESRAKTVELLKSTRISERT
jgi:hypothetical protein